MLSAAAGADFVASDTGEAVTGYGDTDPHAWDGVDLPKPTTDIDRMRADMADWGFCLVEEAVSAEQLAALRKRFDDQIAGEFAAGIGKAQFPQQTGFNCAVNKGELFRQCVTLDEAAIQKGESPRTRQSMPMPTDMKKSPSIRPLKGSMSTST